jgi:hypothetical protein
MNIRTLVPSKQSNSFQSLWLLCLSSECIRNRRPTQTPIYILDRIESKNEALRSILDKSRYALIALENGKGTSYSKKAFKILRQLDYDTIRNEESGFMPCNLRSRILRDPYSEYYRVGRGALFAFILVNT